MREEGKRMPSAEKLISHLCSLLFYFFKVNIGQRFAFSHHLRASGGEGEQQGNVSVLSSPLHTQNLLQLGGGVLAGHKPRVLGVTVKVSELFKK